MKNLFTCLMITLFYIGSIDQAYSQVRLGLKGGLNMAIINFDEQFDIGTKFLPTYMVGTVLDLNFSDYVGIGTGIQFHGKGAKYEHPLSDDARIILGYVQVPVQLQFYQNGFFTAAGPYVAFAISGEDKFGSDADDINFGSTEDDDWSPTDFGLNAEFGYEFGDLRLTGSYSWGLANAIPKEQRDDYDDARITNIVLGLALTYLFGN